MQQRSRQLSQLYTSYRAGALTRRSFIQRALAAGMLLPVALHAANSVSATQTPDAVIPADGFDGLERGAGGDLRLLQWQAPTLLGQHSALGGKDNLGATLVLEPLTNFLPDGTIVPRLITEIPSIENGLLADDSSRVTYHLLPDVTWSDGEPFTANDVKFTWEWVMSPDNASTTKNTYEVIKEVIVEDDLTVTFDFGQPQPAWYVPFSGSWWGAVYPAHILADSGADGYQQFLSNPIGTGPYVVESFTPNDVVTYIANENYREPNKPYFSRVTLKGGGDAASAARAVLETQEFDFAWNVQVEKQVLEQMQSSGNGQVISVPGAAVEWVMLNMSDPNTEIDGERSSLKAPHPFLSDVNVRRALGMAIDRDKISAELYTDGEPPTASVLVGVAGMESDREPVFDPEEAAHLLDEAGWVLDGKYRKKDGLEMSVNYVATVNQIRQKTQAIIKSNLEAIGVKVELNQVDSSQYFDSSPGNEQSYKHFYSDFGMATGTLKSPFPLSRMASWYAGPDNANIAQKANNWSGQNSARYVSAEYDALYQQAQDEIDPEESARIFVEMNDHIVDNQVVIPLVQRAAETYAISNRLSNDNVSIGSFETDYWNIANWIGADAQEG